MPGLRDRHVMVTGAGGGIGRALVEVLTAAGARVSAIDRDPALLDGLDVASRAIFDLSDAGAIRDRMDALIAAQGAPDVVVSNAGWTRAETLAELDDAGFVAELEVNLTGAYRVIDRCLPAMIANGGGAIVAVASVNGLAHYGNPAYAAAKAGLIAWVRALAVEHGQHGIRANAVCPGSVMTPAWNHRFAKDPSLRERVAEHYPLGRLVTAREVAQAVAFLVSPLAAGITGVALPVDAGLTAGNLRFLRDVIGS